MLITVFGPDQSDELGMLDSDNGRVSPQNRSLMTAVLDDLTVQLEYFDHLVQLHTSKIYGH